MSRSGEQGLRAPGGGGVVRERGGFGPSSLDGQQPSLMRLGNVLKTKKDKPVNGAAVCGRKVLVVCVHAR